MIDKTVPMQEAVRRVEPGATLALGGMTIYRRPVAFVRALLRQPQPPDELTLLAFTCGFAADLLVGAGLVARTRTCYFGLETFGLAPMFTRAASTGALQIVEESEASIASGLRAHLAGIGFMPSRAWQGTEMFRARPDVKTISDPYTGEPVTAFPALSCDVAVVHVLQADRAGNARLGGNPTIDAELTLMAREVILTAEEIVPHLDGPLDLVGQTVTTVVHAPQGAWPTSCYPRYAVDGEEILRYIAACNDDRFDDYVKEIAQEGLPP